jgi:hypothetical protein
MPDRFWARCQIHTVAVQVGGWAWGCPHLVTTQLYQKTVNGEAMIRKRAEVPKKIKKNHEVVKSTQCGM